MKKNNLNTINQHNFNYDKAREHALRAIYEGVDIKVDGQLYSYDSNNNILTIKDYCTSMEYHPEIKGYMCNPFAQRIEYKIIED